MDEYQKKYIGGVLVWSLFVSGILFLFICLFSVNIDSRTVEIGIAPLVGLLLVVNMALTAFLVKL
jgi:hypothetical protein